MKITFVTASMNLGGAERQLFLLCDELKDYMEIEIITLDQSGPLFEKYNTTFHNFRIVDSLKYSNVIVLFKLFRLIKNSSPDVVVTWLYKADILAGIATKLAGRIPIIWSARNSAIPKFNFFKRWIMVLLSRILPAVIVANGKPALNFHKSIGYPLPKMIQIQNLLPPWTFKVKSKSKLFSSVKPLTSIRVGLAARQVSGKGILETISAVEQSKFPINLQLIGQSTAVSLNWQSTEIYKNYAIGEIIDDEELSKWFEDLDLYLMASNQWESQPNSLLEAIAIGCPVLVSDKIKLDLDLPPQFVFDFSNKSSLEEAIHNLINLDTYLLQNLIINLQDSVLRRFAKERIVCSWLDLLRSYESLTDK